MKKTLLIAALASMAMPAFAVTDGATYEEKGNYTMTNLWINASGAGAGAWNSLVADGIIANQERVASAVPLGDKIYVASSSKKGVNEEGASVVLEEGQIYVFDYNTGD